jgi:hypothetical protein
MSEWIMWEKDWLAEEKAFSMEFSQASLAW